MKKGYPIAMALPQKRNETEQTIGGGVGLTKESAIVEQNMALTVQRRKIFGSGICPRHRHPAITSHGEFIAIHGAGDVCLIQTR